MKKSDRSRRKFISESAIAAAGLLVAPYLVTSEKKNRNLVKRKFGKIDFEVTTLGLGGQASLQWTPGDVDPVAIVLKAFSLGINYYDTSNLYGPSQVNYGKAFRELDLIPGRSGYNEKLRRSIFLTSKTHLRRAGVSLKETGVSDRTDGSPDGGAAGDLKRTLSQIFGDGNGKYPKGAYLNMVLIHDVSRITDIDAVFRGICSPAETPEDFGALAALRDFRDGTNITGANPGEEKLIRHIGFSGHNSAPGMMEMIRRDKENILEAMLVAINANDLLYRNMQYNVIPVAEAKNMAVIGMKAFADGAMYTRKAIWSDIEPGVVRTVGSPQNPSGKLIKYVLTTPGVHNVIIGIGQISNESKKCQLTDNLAAAQTGLNDLSPFQRKAIEDAAALIKDGKTNYFQLTDNKLTPPSGIAVKQENIGGANTVKITWNTAYAGPAPIVSYDIIRNGKKIGSVSHKPQITTDPFLFTDKVDPGTGYEYIVSTVDQSGTIAASQPVKISQ